MRYLNTVHQKSVAESKRDVRMGSPRPSYGRARNFGTQGHNECGRLGGLGIGPNYLNSVQIRVCIREHLLRCTYILYAFGSPRFH